jgi:hypothetical protein
MSSVPTDPFLKHFHTAIAAQFPQLPPFRLLEVSREMMGLPDGLDPNALEARTRVLMTQGLPAQAAAEQAVKETERMIYAPPRHLLANLELQTEPPQFIRVAFRENAGRAGVL